MKRKKTYRRDTDYSDWGYGRPIETEGGIKARSQQGKFVKNWWATQWIEALERLMDSGRLSRGKSYARKGQVLSIDEVQGGIEARVQGSRPQPYKVYLMLSPLSDAQWEAVLDALAEQALFTAQLLSGEMPQEIEQAFRSAGVSLFPAKKKDLTTSCSCPDMANPCKHIAAVYFILGERFDEDPFLLFRLRGRSQEQILEGLRQRRASGQAAGDESEEAEEQEAFTSLEQVVQSENGATCFWEAGASLDHFSVSVRPPVVEMPLLKRLGEAPFVPQPGIQHLLSSAYITISETALRIAKNDE